MYDIRAIGAAAGLAIDAGKDILENHRDIIQELAVGAVKLPENAFLAGGQDKSLRAAVHQDLFIDLIQVQALIRGGLVVPFEFAGIDVERDGGVAEKLVADAVFASLGLAGAEIDQPQLGIIGARDPGIGAGSLAVGHIAPTVSARLAIISDGVEFPY